MAGQFPWHCGSCWSLRSNRFKKWVMWAALSRMLDLSKCLPPMSYSGLSWGLFTPGHWVGCLILPHTQEDRGRFFPCVISWNRKSRFPVDPPASRTGFISWNCLRPECEPVVGQKNGVTTISLAQWVLCLLMGGGRPEQSRRR